MTKTTIAGTGSPSTVLTEIDQRLDLVSFLHGAEYLREDVRELLKTLDDSSRLLQRLSMRRGNAFDLLGLKRSIVVATQITRQLTNHLDSHSIVSPVLGGQRLAVDAIIAGLGDHAPLAQEIEEAIDEEVLLKRTLEAEKRAGIEEALGATAADRAMQAEEDGSEWTEGLWGKNEKWAIRSK